MDEFLIILEYLNSMEIELNIIDIACMYFFSDMQNQTHATNIFMLNQK